MAAVRKWIVIGLLILSAIGVLAYVFSGPKRGSVEWHKREYRNARMKLEGHTCFDRVRTAYAQITGSTVRDLADDDFMRLCEKTMVHERVLLDMGFLGRREVQVTPTNLMIVLQYLNSREAIMGYVSGSFSGAPLASSRMITVTAPCNDLPKWERFVKTNVPAGK